MTSSHNKLISGGRPVEPPHYRVARGRLPGGPAALPFYLDITYRESPDAEWQPVCRYTYPTCKGRDDEYTAICASYRRCGIKIQNGGTK